MKKIAIAELYFLTKDEGGQEKLITGDFSTPIRFDEDTDQKYGLWSAVIEFIKKPNENRKATARVFFLFSDNEESPKHLLKKGGNFRLINSRIVASGKINEIIYE